MNCSRLGGEQVLPIIQVRIIGYIYLSLSGSEREVGWGGVGVGAY